MSTRQLPFRCPTCGKPAPNVWGLRLDCQRADDENRYEADQEARRRAAGEQREAAKAEELEGIERQLKVDERRENLARLRAEG